MKKMNIKHSLFTLLLIGLILGCEEKDPLPEIGVIYVTEAITTPTTWLEGNIYMVDITGDFRIEALLTIEPNVIVKFLYDHGEIIVKDGGVVLALGTAEKPIIFTSPYDDLHGGDNTGNGATAPAPGDWGKFYFKDVSGSKFSFCQFYYGGGSGVQTLKVMRSTIDIDNCVFAYNLGGEQSSSLVGVVDLDLANLDCSITNSVFYSNVLPLSIDANLSIDNSNMFFDPENPETGNVMNGIFTDSYTIDGKVSWLETEVPFVIANGYGLRIESNGSLTLPDGGVLKFVAGSSIDLRKNPDQGIINSDGVYFTSIRDDELLGDTDGNGSSLVPTDGDWEGILIASSPLTYAAWPNILYDEIHE